MREGSGIEHLDRNIAEKAGDCCQIRSRQAFPETCWHTSFGGNLINQYSRRGRVAYNQNPDRVAEENVSRLIYPQFWKILRCDVFWFGLLLV